MPSLRRTASPLALFAVVAATDVATAADAYLCDGSRLVYVELAELEHKIRTDPCIARYHGVLPHATGSSASDPPLVRFSDPLEMPQAASSPLPSTVAAGAIEPSRAAAPSATKLRRRQEAAAQTSGPAGVRAAPDTDYRNVRIINASQDADRWYRLPRP